MRIVVTEVKCISDTELESAILSNQKYPNWDFIGATSVYGKPNTYMLMYRDPLG